MLKLNYELNINQLNNPILCAVIICVSYAIITLLLVRVSFVEIQQITLVHFMVTVCVLYIHYNQLRKKYDDELMKEKSNTVLNKLNPEYITEYN